MLLKTIKISQNNFIVGAHFWNAQRPIGKTELNG